MKSLANKINKKFIALLTFALLILPALTYAQTESINPETESIFRSHDKIFVVVLVLFTIFVGIILVLLYLDRRVKRLEKTFLKK